MPVNPQFIPISKKRQMLAVSSWRRPAATDSVSESNIRECENNNNYSNSSSNTNNDTSSSLPSYTPMQEHQRSGNKINNTNAGHERGEYVRNDKDRPYRHRRRGYSYSHDETTPLPSSHRNNANDDDNNFKNKHGPTRAYHSSKLTYKQNPVNEDYYHDDNCYGDCGNGANRRSNTNTANKGKEYNQTSSNNNTTNEEDNNEVCDYYVHVNFPHDIDVKEFKEQLCQFICPIKCVELGHRVNLIDRKNSISNNNPTQSSIVKKGSAKNNKSAEVLSAQEEENASSSSSESAIAESSQTAKQTSLPNTNANTKMTVLGKPFDIEAFKTPAWTTAAAPNANQHHATNSSNWHSSSSDPLHDAEAEWAVSGANENEWTPGALPPAISLPPAELDLSAAQQIDNINKPHSVCDVHSGHNDDASHSRHGTHGNEAVTSTSFIREVEKEYFISVLYAERSEAEAAVEFIHKHWPSCSTRIALRDAHTHNCTLVCKNAPNLSAWTNVMNEMTLHNCAPTYYRFLHSEHGSFRGIVFLKYANRELAESSKMKLELMSVSGKSLRVEFKRKAVLANSITSTGGNNYKKAGNNSSHNQQRQQSNKLHKNDIYNNNKEEEEQQTQLHDVNKYHEMPLCANNTNEVGSEPIDIRAPLLPSTELHLTKLIRALRTSVENEGVMFARNELTNAEVRVLKQRCLTYGMHFYMDEKQIRVQRSFGGYSVFAHHNTTITESNPSKVDSQIQKNVTVVASKNANSSTINDTYNRWSSAHERSRAYHQENDNNQKYQNDVDNTYHRPSPGLYALPRTTAAVATTNTTNVTLSSSSHNRSSSTSSSSVESSSHSPSRSTSSSRTTSYTSSATSSSANTPAMRYATHTNTTNVNTTEGSSDTNTNNDRHHHHYHHHHHRHHNGDESTRTNTSSHVSSSQTNTPAWAPATPAPFRPMDFKGIRHWRDIQGEHAQLGIIRPLGPDDGLVAFAAGRGRPV